MSKASARKKGKQSKQAEQAVDNVAAAAAILEHVREHIGIVDSVFHEIEADDVGIDIHHVPPTKKRKVHTLVTSGMSDRAMPEGAGVRYGELVMCLPADWPLDEESLENGKASWPLEMLRALGRLPHEHAVAYDFGLCTDDRALPFAQAGEAGFTGILLAPPVTVPDAFWCLDAGEGKIVDFFGIVMLYPQELAFARFEGVVALARKLDALKVTELVQPKRKAAV